MSKCQLTQVLNRRLPTSTGERSFFELFDDYLRGATYTFKDGEPLFLGNILKNLSAFHNEDEKSLRSRFLYAAALLKATDMDLNGNARAALCSTVILGAE